MPKREQPRQPIISAVGVAIGERHAAHAQHDDVRHVGLGDQVFGEGLDALARASLAVVPMQVRPQLGAQLVEVFLLVDFERVAALAGVGVGFGDEAVVGSVVYSVPLLLFLF